MSGFEHYDRELAGLDREIHHYAAICGVDLADRHAVDACLDRVRDDWVADKARSTLNGLLLLRIKLETEMLRQGLKVPRLMP